MATSPSPTTLSSWRITFWISTGFLELIAFIEETFEVRVEDQEMVPENLDSLLKIENYVGRKRAEDKGLGPDAMVYTA